MSGILPEGTDVGYYVGEKRLLDGYIKELGIYCHCCNTVVSPSQFEGHAGRAARRKLYHNIYMSNGVSPHELSTSLSKGRKTSDRQSDDLCSICSDGGELLLCDTCPRAFHRGSMNFAKRNLVPELCCSVTKEYHVGCLKEHSMADLTALPEGAWYCSTDCVKICEALKDLVSRGAEPVPAADVNLIKKKREEKGLKEDGEHDVRWRVLRDKSSEDSKLVLSKAVAISHESFDPIIQTTTGRDLIRAMLYGRSVRDQDYTGIKTVVSAGLFRVMGIGAAELPLVATSRDNQGLGYFQALFACIELLLSPLGVKHFLLPAADEAVSIWMQRFGFAKITRDEVTNMKKEIDAIRVKDIPQGGLTQGQQTQIARNERRMSQIMEELENLEETLNDSIQESLGARTGKPKRGSHKASLEEEEEVIRFCTSD